MTDPDTTAAVLAAANSRSSAPTRTVDLGNVTVVLPPASDGAVSEGLREITRALLGAGLEWSGGLLGGEDGYGVRFENDTFGMHPYCWCERSDCPWCAACECPDEAWTYLVDGVPVDGEGFYATGGYGGPGVREVVVHPELRCARHQPGAFGAPHFWHKPSGTWVTWYKYIGRGTEMSITGNWHAIVAECLASIPVSMATPDGWSADPQPPAFGPATGPEA